MLRNMAFALGASMFLYTGSAAAVNTDEDGCFQPISGCLTVQARWQGDDRLMTTYSNGCQERVYVKACNEKKSGGMSCGAFGIPRGDTGGWNTYNATGDYWFAFVGSTIGGNDWVCSGKHRGWDKY